MSNCSLSAIGKRIKAFRNAKEITQQKFANDMGVPRETIAKWETGRQDFKTQDIIRIAEYFDVPTDYLLGRIEAKSPEPTVQNAVSYTGLTEEAVEILHSSIEENPFMPLVLSFLIESDRKGHDPKYVSATFRALAFAIWESFIKYPPEPRINASTGEKYKETQVDVQGTVSGEHTSINADVYADAVFLSLLTELKKLRDSEFSERPSRFRDMFIDIVKKRG